MFYDSWMSVVGCYENISAIVEPVVLRLGGGRVVQFDTILEDLGDSPLGSQTGSL